MPYRPHSPTRIRNLLSSIALVWLAIGMLQPPLGLAIDRAPRTRGGSVRASGCGSQRCEACASDIGSPEELTQDPDAFGVDVLAVASASPGADSSTAATVVARIPPALLAAPSFSWSALVTAAAAALPLQPRSLAAGRAPPLHI